MDAGIRKNLPERSRFTSTFVRRPMGLGKLETTSQQIIQKSLLYKFRVVLIGPPPKSYAVHPLGLIRSTLSLIGPGHPLSLKASTIFPTQGGVYFCHIDLRNSKPT